MASEDGPGCGEGSPLLGDRRSGANSPTSIWGQRFGVLLLARAMITSAGTIISVAMTPIYLSLVCCRADNKNCLDAEWCKDIAIRSKLSSIIIGRSTAAAWCGFFALLIWSPIWMSVNARNSSYLKGALIASDIGLFASEAMQPLVAYILSMRDQWPLEWVWATPITSLVLFGGPHMVMVSCSILVSRRAESHRAISFALLELGATVVSSLSELLAAFVLDRNGEWACVFIGLAIYAAGIFTLFFIRVDETVSETPPPRTSGVETPAYRVGRLPQILRLPLHRIIDQFRNFKSMIPTFFTALLYSPLVHSISPTFALQYTNKHFSTPMSQGALLSGVATFFAIVAPLTSLARKSSKWGEKTSTRIDLVLAIACLTLAAVANLVMTVSWSLVPYVVALCAAYISSAYSIFTRSILASQTPSRASFGGFTIYELFQVVGSSLANMWLIWSFKTGMEIGIPGLPYILGTATCAIGALLLTSINLDGSDEQQSDSSDESPE